MVSVTVNEAAEKRRPNGAYDIPGAGADSDTGSRNNRIDMKLSQNGVGYRVKRHYNNRRQHRIDADNRRVGIRSEEEDHREHRRNNGIELGRTPDNPLMK